MTDAQSPPPKDTAPPLVDIYTLNEKLEHIRSLQLETLALLRRLISRGTTGV